MSDKQQQLFKTRLVPGKEGSGKLFEEEFVVDDGPVECLGMTFENDEQRREYFLEKLREKLKDPEFRKIEGFPIGEDEDILALSDPPYYTACPNPFIEDFIKQYGKPYGPDVPYSREPFAADVSEGKNDPIYNAHSYHTKVPHKAIMRYILHYTEPGDVVFDGFCGTGMTGVAAQMCGDRATVESLGYQVKPDGTILRQETDENGKNVWVVFSKLGPRQAVLNDLSPAATFIAYNYNTPVDVAAFEREAKRILKEVEEECGWMYETTHSDGRGVKINYIVWSDVFVCPDCASDIIFWDSAVDKSTWQVNDDFCCSSCGAEVGKRGLDRAWISHFDDVTGKVYKLAKQVPVLIHYKLAGSSYTKKPDTDDLGIIDKINKTTNPYWYPNNKLPVGDKMSDPRGVGIQNASDFYTKRALYNLSKYSDLSRKSNLNTRLLINLTSSAVVLSRQYRFRSQGGHLGAGGGPMNGTLYVPSLLKEIPVTKVIGQHIGRMSKVLSSLNNGGNVVQTGSLSSLKNLKSDSVDYLFIDPPFGSNIMYSELNFLWESWLRVMTNNKEEAIENRTQKKRIDEYRKLMADCFSEAYRLLKPSRWMTVEFSNTKASVWNSIQTALTEAGFIVANVSALDKKQGSFNAVTNTTSVKQDLIISAYKPNGGFEEREVNLFLCPNATLVSSSIRWWPFLSARVIRFPFPARSFRSVLSSVSLSVTVCFSCLLRRPNMTAKKCWAVASRSKCRCLFQTKHQPLHGCAI
jgi:DNA modification methylase